MTASGFKIRVTGVVFVFNSLSLALKKVPTCIQKPKTNTSNKSIKFLHWLFLVSLCGFKSFQMVLCRFRSFIVPFLVVLDCFRLFQIVLDCFRFFSSFLILVSTANMSLAIHPKTNSNINQLLIQIAKVKLLHDLDSFQIRALLSKFQRSG